MKLGVVIRVVFFIKGQVLHLGFLQGWLDGGCVCSSGVGVGIGGLLRMRRLPRLGGCLKEMRGGCVKQVDILSDLSIMFLCCL